MRIAVVSHVMPYPADSGTRIRVAHVVRALGRQHDLTVLSLEPGDARGAAAALGVPVAVEPARARRGLAPVLVAAETTAAVWRCVRRWRADAVHLQGTFGAAAAGLAGSRADVPAVVDEGCVYHRSFCRAAALAPTRLARARGRLRTWRLRRFEQAVARHADAVIAVCPEEAALVHRLAPGTRVVVAPNGVDPDALAPTPPGDAALFVGLLSYGPNRDAVTWFAREVAPRLGSDGPDVLVAGRDPGPELEALAGATRLRLLGFVPDLAPLYARAGVFVNPMRGGGGTRLKVLEAMAAGKAVISTSVGAEGLALTPGRDVVIADTAVEFAAAVRGLLASPGQAERLGRAARALVETRYRWEICATPIEELYASLDRRGAGA